LGGAAESINEAQPDSSFEYVNGSLAEDADSLPAGARILSGGTTSLITGGLEASKTDLATEIAGMITTQRGYQANTRIITVTDSMLEELVNMKR
jgi:flagellar hook protein FlgE